MYHQEGIEAVVNSKVVPSTIILLLTSPDITINTKIVELFSDICAFSNKVCSLPLVRSFIHLFIGICTSPECI